LAHPLKCEPNSSQMIHSACLIKSKYWPRDGGLESGEMLRPDICREPSLAQRIGHSVGQWYREGLYRHRYPRIVAEHPGEIDNEILAEGRDRGSIGCIADIVRAGQLVRELEKRLFVFLAEVRPFSSLRSSGDGPGSSALDGAGRKAFHDLPLREKGKD